MPILIKPAPLKGCIAAIPSKADAHRKIISAALAEKPTIVSPQPQGNDIDATIASLVQLGANIQAQAGGLLITPITPTEFLPLINCQESGATLRFLLPLAAALVDRADFTGRGHLAARPLAGLINVLKEHGISFSSEKLPFRICGHLEGGLYRLPGHISSQYISGLLFALPLTNLNSTLLLTSAIQAPGYVHLTLATLRDFGINILQEGNSYLITGCQHYQSPGNLELNGDWSNAAFFLTSGALAGPVSIQGLSLNSHEPDKDIINHLVAFGAKVEIKNKTVTVHRGNLCGQEIDIAPIADLAPVLAVLGALAEGRTVLKNAMRLRYKESDRLHSITTLLTALGARIVNHNDSLIIEGTDKLRGGEVRCHGDHRIVMAAAVAASACQQMVIIRDADAVNKSYPNFFADYRSLGGNAITVQLA